MGLMKMIFSAKGNNQAGVKMVEQSPVDAFRTAGRADSWGPNKLPTAGVHSTVPKPEKVHTVNPSQLGKMQAKAQQRTENAERWDALMKSYEQISNADAKEHLALRRFQKTEMGNHVKKLNSNANLAAFAEGQQLAQFQEDRAWNAIQQQHQAMTDELQMWNAQMAAALNN